MDYIARCIAITLRQNGHGSFSKNDQIDLLSRNDSGYLKSPVLPWDLMLLKCAILFQHRFGSSLIHQIYHPLIYQHADYSAYEGRLAESHTSASTSFESSTATHFIYPNFFRSKQCFPQEYVSSNV